LVRTAFVGFLFVHIKATKLKLFCADLWGKQDGRLLDTTLAGWRAYAAQRKLKHASQTWALVRHHVRRNVHRAFVRLLAFRALKIKNRVDREDGKMWGVTRILARAFWGLCQAASYLKSVRIRTLAFTHGDMRKDDMPVAMGHEEASRRVRICRQSAVQKMEEGRSKVRKAGAKGQLRSIANNFVCRSFVLPSFRSSQVEAACRRAVGVGGRWNAGTMPDSLRWQGYKNVEKKLWGTWVEEDVYDPLKNYLWPAERLDAERGRAGKGSGMVVAGEEDEGGFKGLKARFEGETSGAGRRQKVGSMVRTLGAFLGRGVAMDPNDFRIKLPGDYGAGGFMPPAGYGLNADGKLQMYSSVEETALGASRVRLVKRVWGGWVDVVGWKRLCRTVFEWGRRRMLLLVWRPLWTWWRNLKGLRLVGEKEGEVRLLRRLLGRWMRFTREMMVGKVAFIRRTFVRRVEYIVKAWAAWAKKKGKKKRIADRHWYRNGGEIG